MTTRTGVLASKSSDFRKLCETKIEHTVAINLFTIKVNSPHSSISSCDFYEEEKLHTPKFNFSGALIADKYGFAVSIPNMLEHRHPRIKNSAPKIRQGG